MAVNHSHTVPGQGTLPALAEELGYEAITLKPKWEQFCWEYVLGKSDGKTAYLKVYPKVKERTARANSARLLANAAISQRIQQIREELRRRYAVTADDIMMYHGRVLKQDVREYFDANGKPLSVPEMTTESVTILDLASHVDRKHGLMYIPKFPSKFQAAQELAKILGMYEEPPVSTFPPEIMLKFMTDVELFNRAEQLLEQLEEQKPKLIEEK
jgi:hypothetical protein